MYTSTVVENLMHERVVCMYTPSDSLRIFLLFLLPCLLSMYHVILLNCCMYICIWIHIYIYNILHQHIAQYHVLAIFCIWCICCICLSIHNNLRIRQKELSQLTDIPEKLNNWRIKRASFQYEFYFMI